MKPREFITQLDEKWIIDAIAEAERQTSGEIRVYVSHKPRDDIMAAAQRRFEKLGMTNTRQRNGVLIYFAPLVQKFAIVGDAGIDEKCGGSFWQEISATMSERLKEGQLTEAIVMAIGRVGAALAKHFPPTDDDRNELPNEIASG